MATKNRIAEVNGNGHAASVTAPVTISRPNLQTAALTIRGTSPYVQCRFSQKAQNMIEEKQREGSTANKKKGKAARDIEADYEGAKHVSKEGWLGIPASAFRAAMVSACRLVGFKMTLAKLSVFVVPDGFDAVDGVPLVRINGEPELHKIMGRNATGVVDLRVRPMFREWSATVNIQYDADQFTVTDITNLMLRVGQQIGIGEGRHDSRMSTGLGWGTFTLEGM